MTRQQKERLARAVLGQVAHLIEFPELLPAELADVPHDEVAAQLTTWMKYLPGDVWDTRLPQPPR